MMAGYVGGVQDTIPATFLQLGELLPSCYLAAIVQSVPTDWVKVSASDLAGPLPWYKTVPGTADATEEAPGEVVILTSGLTDTYAIEYRGVFEFKTSVNSVNTPAAQEAHALVRAERVRLGVLSEKLRILNIIGTPTGK